jgi:bifunctional non-homologous end joining protein LigD
MSSAAQLPLELEGQHAAVRPMQPMPVEAPFSSPEYVFEVKWDGMRCLLFRDGEGRLRLQDRALRDVTDLVPEVVAAAQQVPPGTVLDGELVATDGEGRPDAPALRSLLAGVRRRDEPASVAYLAFDLLYADGRSLLRHSLARRKAKLHRIVRSGGHLFVPGHIEGDGVELFEACLERGLEGMIAKHASSTYVPGGRNPFWLTVKAVKSDDFVVIGTTGGDPFGALLVGYHEAGRLLPCGAVTGGFDDESTRLLDAELRRLAQDHCSLHPAPIVTAPVRWCRPELVVNVRYSEWAADGTLRFPIFNRVRRDLHPTECVRHRPRVVLEGRTPAGSPALDLTRFPF